ncbi:hypothetical protein QQF64_035656 [Cirrhinus molitorella]|uniref:Uncharacterized protein n=1 Tax=Cirrhinus molitorella TaxID=172907 RepID=A0ABR3NGF2_9TELE
MFQPAKPPHPSFGLSQMSAVFPSCHRSSSVANLSFQVVTGSTRKRYAKYDKTIATGPPLQVLGPAPTVSQWHRFSPSLLLSSTRSRLSYISQV